MQSISRLFTVLLLLLSVTMVATAKDKQRLWQDGVLLDSDTSRGTRIANFGDDIQTLRNDLTYYQIDSGKMVYVVARSLRSRRDKALDITINGHVHFAIEGDTCYLQDDNGKEHKLTVEKKIAKP